MDRLFGCRRREPAPRLPRLPKGVTLPYYLQI